MIKNYVPFAMDFWLDYNNFSGVTVCMYDFYKCVFYDYL